MMTERIVLKQQPKIEFQFSDQGFQLIDEQTGRNTGFYAFSDLQFIELNNVWFPRLAKWLRIFTWIFNGVPFFPDAETYKKANIILHFRKKKLGMWLTSVYMADKAKVLKELLDKKSQQHPA